MDKIYKWVNYKILIDQELISMSFLWTINFEFYLLAVKRLIIKSFKKSKMIRTKNVQKLHATKTCEFLRIFTFFVLCT